MMELSLWLGIKKIWIKSLYHDNIFVYWHYRTPFDTTWHLLTLYNNDSYSFIKSTFTSFLNLQSKSFSNSMEKSNSLIFTKLHSFLNLFLYNKRKKSLPPPRFFFHFHSSSFLLFIPQFNKKHFIFRFHILRIFLRASITIENLEVKSNRIIWNRIHLLLSMKEERISRLIETIM